MYFLNYQAQIISHNSKNKNFSLILLLIYLLIIIHYLNLALIRIILAVRENLVFQFTIEHFVTTLLLILKETICLNHLEMAIMANANLFLLIFSLLHFYFIDQFIYHFHS